PLTRETPPQARIAVVFQDPDWRMMHAVLTDSWPRSWGDGHISIRMLRSHPGASFGSGAGRGRGHERGPVATRSHPGGWFGGARRCGHSLPSAKAGSGEIWP